MTGGAWSCPHELEGRCGKIGNLPCDPGRKGCVLYGRYVFFDAGKNARLEEKQARKARAAMDGLLSRQESKEHDHAELHRPHAHLDRQRQK